MDAQAQQQIIERISQANNILVTVSNNPSVDQLAACIGFTLLLNKMGKHATAVFSGEVPSTLEFLEPAKTLENNTNSLRDFIISLDKNKADKLRYKVEDQFVRIFITPYRTSITDKDLVFSQGDFNVEVILAMGVHKQSELDAAITAHGRILHDATVISMVVGNTRAAAIGQINIADRGSSSFCETLANLGESLGQNLLDAQISTALLTGIVAETNRFSNDKTSPKVMSVSAKLMAAGANQQLIVNKLEKPAPPPPQQPPEQPPDSGQPPPKKPPPEPPKPAPGELSISHGDEKKQETAEVEVTEGEIRIDEQGNIIPSDAVDEKPVASTPQLPQLSKFAAPVPVQPAPLANAASGDLPVIPPPMPPQAPPSVIQEVEALPPVSQPQASQASAASQVVEPNEPKLPEVRQPEAIPDELKSSSHSLLSIQPESYSRSAFTADTQPGWRDDQDPEHRDALGEDKPAPTPILQRDRPELPVHLGEKSIEPPLEVAQKKVETILANQQWTPANHPIEALNAQPMGEPLHSQPQTPQSPPPSMAPPLMQTSRIEDRTEPTVSRA